MVWRGILCCGGLFTALLPLAPAQELLKDGKPQLPISRARAKPDFVVAGAASPTRTRTSSTFERS
jgi:hypothetical protein